MITAAASRAASDSWDQLLQQGLAHVICGLPGQFVGVGVVVLAGGGGEEKPPRAGQDPGQAIVLARHRGGLQRGLDVGRMRGTEDDSLRLF